MRSSERGRAEKSWHDFGQLVFDIDGTLLNSNLAHVWAWQDAIEAEELFFPHFTLFAQMGLPGPQIVEKFGFALRDHKTAQRIAERAAELYAEKYVRLVSPYDGAYRLLRKLKSRGHRLFALTSASKTESDSMLRRFRLESYFELVLTAEDSGAGKPTPEPFSRLKESIGSRLPLLSVGDSPYDQKASNAAGVPFVYLGHGGFPREWFQRAFASFFNINAMIASLPSARARQRQMPVMGAA